MVILQTEAPASTLEEQIIPQMDESSESQDEMEASQENGAHGYEQLREKRIKENQERMQKLGLFSLSLKMKSVKPTRKNNFSGHKISPSPALSRPIEPPRRSSRLQSVSPIGYCELKAPKVKNLKTEIVLMRMESPRPEIYTEEHEKLLGNAEKVWTLFVDGIGNDGKRIYDSVKGKTCHQCRQKTLGHRTHCINCKMVQGQFCGDCLYMRYGENVLEANENPNWICPVCRGICNCSLCRQGKGWAATGPLYRKISRLGFKSVAHYLIQTYRSQTENESPKTEDIPHVPFEDNTEKHQGQTETKGNVISQNGSPKTEDILFEANTEKHQGQSETEGNVIKTEHEMKDQSSLSEKDGDVDNQIIENVSKADGVVFETGQEFPGDNNVGVAPTHAAKTKSKKRHLEMEDSIGRRTKLRCRGSKAVLF